jgi:hypothetical protein
MAFPTVIQAVERITQVAGRYVGAHVCPQHIHLYPLRYPWKAALKQSDWAVFPSSIRLLPQMT